MANPGYSQVVLDEAVALVEAHGSVGEASKASGIHYSTLEKRYKRATGKDKAPPAPTAHSFDLPDFPEEDIPVEDVIEHQIKRFKKRQASYEAHTWFPVKIKGDGPMGIVWFGDPHVDDNGCNWPLLKHHVEICRKTEALYGVNIGDATNCWGGRLIKKYADQDASIKTARRLAEWFLLKSGVNWLVWLYGNHEHMGDGASVLQEMAKRFGTRKVVMHDWEARFSLDFPNGQKVRVWCAHDFPGNSMWNPLHGPVKAARFGAGIDLLVCGHKHNWGVSQWELSEQDAAPLMVRTRGYKFFDDYAKRIGKVEQNDGASILTVINPDAKTKSARIQAFVDVEEGADFLTWLRKRK